MRIVALPSILLLLTALAAASMLPVAPALADDGLRTAVQIDLRTRSYPNEQTSHVMQVAAEIFELAQANYRIVYGKQGVIAYREWGWKTIVDKAINL
ncbi:MAG: hypothetical protein KKB70_04045, partial [Proteobacteria bacterium]|nr:hypothetical protein [Pseudomonadota bacterium]